MAQWVFPIATSIVFLAIFLQLSVSSINDLETLQGAQSRGMASLDSRRRSKENSNHVTDRGSVFATENSTVVKAQVGGTASLPCTVRKFSSGVVTWIRRRDYHLLTVGLTTYIADGRYFVEHARHLQNWGLQIKHVVPTDAGLYECQVSNHPPTSIFIELEVLEAAAEIFGAPDLHINSGSTLRLVCTLKHSTEPPEYVFWYHEDRMINYDLTRSVTVATGRSSSVLTIAEAEKTDNGNYTCLPSNAKPASINVHVLNNTAGEKPAAMQHANTSTSSTAHLMCLSLTTFLISVIFRMLGNR